MFKKLYRIGAFLDLKIKNDPNGSRTRVAAVKGQCPRPLDDGVINSNCYRAVLYTFFGTCQDNSSFHHNFPQKAANFLDFQTKTIINNLLHEQIKYRVKICKLTNKKAIKELVFFVTKSLNVDKSYIAGMKGI